MEKKNLTEMKANDSSASLLSLMVSFAKIGLFTFGGGYAMLPMLERECVEKHGWVTNDELTEYFAIGQCTPGVIAVNTATFIGRKKRGMLGAASATFGVVFPSVVIIVIIAALISNFAHLPAVQHAFSGIRAAVAALIVNAVIRLVRSNVKNWLAIAIASVAFFVTVFFKPSPVIVVLCAAVCGIVYGIIGRRRKSPPESDKGGEEDAK